LLLELRALQEQVQKMQLTVNQLAEKLKATDSRLDTQANDTRKGFADQKNPDRLDFSRLRTLNERENEGSVRIAQFSQELRAIREGLASQQSTLGEMPNLLQPLSAAAFAAAAATSTPMTDPATAAAQTGGRQAPTAALKTARDSAQSNGVLQHGLWVLLRRAMGTGGNGADCGDSEVPRLPDAARAQFNIGESYFQWGKHYQEALAAYTAVVTNYKDPEVVSEALYKQGMTYEQLGQKDAAIKSYQQVIKLYKGSAAEILATTALRRLVK
jgi:TolA-binding protein